ncbi:hypothetical protein ACERZ8_21435 [Tateyamaria armeniaca]|uniref:Uncharacterized protein n=1 Tax=Tateyamaria armeniaca TaxID=2518930 RepID=A0ABW8UZZ0_9RHOB
MFRSCRYALTGLVAAIALQPAPMALAQGLEIAPIGFDVADDGDNLVLAAFAAQTMHRFLIPPSLAQPPWRPARRLVCPSHQSSSD